MKKLHVIVMVFFSTSMLIVGQTSGAKKEYSVVPNSRPGLINITELNVGIGLYEINVDYSLQQFNFYSILGIGIAKNLTAGIGIGYSLYNGRRALFPLFADFRYFTHIGKTRVFVFGDSGILLNSAKNVSGTMIFVNPGIGMVLPISDNLSVGFGAGLFTQFRQDYDHDSFIIIKNGMIYSFNSKKN